MIELFQVIAGLVILIAGGELLVRGAVALANKFAVPPLIIGLTIVAFGTSAPEMVVSIQAVLDGFDDISLGNIIGSNITNILIVLGLAALVHPVSVDSKLLKRDTPFMMFSTVIFAMFMFTGEINRIHAVILLSIIGAYLLYLFSSVRKGADKELLQEVTEETAIFMPLWRSSAYIVTGLGLLIFGSDLMVKGASALAMSFGVTEAMVGMTIVALGTSAPELITSLVAAYRKHSDIAIGNVIGSNLFNITAIGGAAAMLKPIYVNPIFLNYDVWIFILTGLLVIAFMLTGNRICRREGVLLIGGYIGYTWWQVIQGGM
jgi:cation:H+ antiporter